MYSCLLFLVSVVLTNGQFDLVREVSGVTVVAGLFQNPAHQLCQPCIMAANAVKNTNKQPSVKEVGRSLREMTSSRFRRRRERVTRFWRTIWCATEPSKWPASTWTGLRLRRSARTFNCAEPFPLTIRRWGHLREGQRDRMSWQSRFWR